MEPIAVLGNAGKVLQVLPDFFQVSFRTTLAFLWVEIVGILLSGTLLWLALKCLSNIWVLGRPKAGDREPIGKEIHASDNGQGIPLTSRDKRRQVALVSERDVRARGTAVPQRK